MARGPGRLCQGSVQRHAVGFLQKRPGQLLKREVHSRQPDAANRIFADHGQTVPPGFQGGEDNLATLRVLEDELRVQDEAVRRARESVTLTTNQHKAGMVSDLIVMAMHAVALNNGRVAVGILGRRLTASVGLIKFRLPTESPDEPNFLSFFSFGRAGIRQAKSR